MPSSHPGHPLHSSCDVARTEPGRWWPPTLVPVSALGVEVDVHLVGIEDGLLSTGAGRPAFKFPQAATPSASGSGAEEHGAGCHETGDHSSQSPADGVTDTHNSSCHSNSRASNSRAYVLRCQPQSCARRPPSLKQPSLLTLQERGNR